MFCTLATVDARGGAAARTVVCRRVTAQGDFYLFADARSEKVAQVRENASAEMVFWLPRRREQFRVKGKITLAADPALRSAFWAELSASARAMYLWPTPGSALDDAAPFPRAVDASHAVPETFAVLLLSPGAIEALDLNAHPHDRRRWERADGWVERRLNP
jgi:pyridoxamine 5'-phosphate oxidase